MAFKTWESFRLFEQEVKRTFRYIHSEDSHKFLSEIRATLPEMTKSLKAGTPLQRAQIAHGWRHYSEEIGEIECPAPIKRMFPKIDGASEGRANSKGIPCLYLASNTETAIAEVRPWADALVSVVSVSVMKDLQIVDCTLHKSAGMPIFFHADKGMYEPDENTRKETVWEMINNAFSKPVTDDGFQADYAPTQILTELFRREGLDGLGFKSSLGDGYNVALFDVNSVQAKWCDLHRIEQVSYKHSEYQQGYSVQPKKS